jgi:iron(III) transport system permease protein
MSELTSLPNLPVMRTRRHPLLIGVVALIVAVMVLPIVSLLVLSATSGASEIADLFTTVLPSSLKTTVQLMLIVGVLTSSIGVVSAYLIITYEFPFRRTLSWMLVLPVAVPAYIASYCFVDFLTFAGPVQTALRGIMGYKTHSDYWFPDIRSVWGAGFIIASVLYPYVYLTTRVVFLMQGRNAADVARSLGASRTRVFFQVLLPMARPAIVAGVALALMETLNDIGAVEYLGVKTLTFSIYNTWLGRGSLGGAAQLAVIMLALVLVLLWVETYARRKLRFNAGRANHILATTSRQSLH